MPLRWKLVAIYAVVLALVIAGFSLAMVAALRTTLERGAAVEVDARARGLGAVVEFEGGAWVIEPKADIAPQYAEGSGLYYRVADAQGAIVSASPLAITLQPDQGALGERVWHAGDQRYVETTIAVQKVGDDDEPAHPTTLLVTCGKDLHEVDFAVASLTGHLLWLGPLVLVVSLIGGLFLAGRALRPIDVIARTASAIGAQDLGRRIPVHGRDELAALATTLNRTFERLQQAFERESRFTADASHELRTPLTAIAGNVELALGRERSAQELRELMAEIGSASQQMRSVIDGLLALARAEDGALAKDLVELGPLCRQVVHDESARAQASDIDLRCEIGDTPAVRGDRSCLVQALSNLIQNGVRHNRPGGHVVVRAGMRMGVARIEVEDDGIGIPQDALPHLGERFFRLDPSRTRATGGVGLGLSIVGAIVRAHGGAMQIDSEVGRGTRVAITLPSVTGTASGGAGIPIDGGHPSADTPAARSPR